MFGFSIVKPPFSFTDVKAITMSFHINYCILLIIHSISIIALKIEMENRGYLNALFQ